MRLIKKLRQPTLLQKYIRQVGASYEEMDKEVKDELKQTLIKEQHGVCAYCQKILKKGKNVTIEHHCETFNVTNGLPIKINPTNSAHISTIRYSSSGLISSSNDLYDKEINEILNLNIGYLKDLRKRKCMFFFRQSFENKNINVKKMEKLLDADLSKKGGNFPNSFPGLSDYMKKKFC